MAMKEKSWSLNSKLLLGEPINSCLRDHALSLNSSQWEHRELLLLLHDWAEIFVREFDLGLVIPALQIEPISVRRLGTYRPGRNGLGLQHEITLNSRHADRGLAEMLSTEFHELLHQWQEMYGKSGRRNYHNRQFRQKAGLYGLIVDDRGHTSIEPGRFTTLLTKHGVDLNSLPSAEANPVRARPRGNSKMRKYSCGCTNVRCAVRLTARCLVCGLEFRESAPSW